MSKNYINEKGAKIVADSLLDTSLEMAKILDIQLASHHKKWLEAYNGNWDRRLQLPSWAW
ncbi:MAG: hypothetical protein R2883_03290 [Caldisericia bacterium]